MAAGNGTFSFLDDYCERAGDPHLWAEPLNAVSNLAFIIAAFLAWRLWRREELSARASWDILLLTLVLASIGIGSGAWHIFANSHTLLMDVIPIVIFMNIYLASAAIRLMRQKWWGAVGLLALFQALNIASETFLPRALLHGSIMYIPAFLMLFIITGHLWRHKHPGCGLVLKATLIFTASLAFRTLDLEICEAWPYGTHFLWHLLNATMLFILLKALLDDAGHKKTLGKPE